MGENYVRYWNNTSFTTSSTLTFTISQPALAETNEGKPEMQEHHIDRDQLITVIRGNKEAYQEYNERYRELYSEELTRQTNRHLDGEISASQIQVRDKDGQQLALLTDMTSVFDQQIRELELDSRDVVILTHEEYGQYVDGTSSNLKSLEDHIKRLEERLS